MANDTGHAEHLYHDLRQRVHDLRGAVSDNRIYLLKFRTGDHLNTLAVGDSFRAVGGEPVLAIFETGDGFDVCTWAHGATTGEPYRIPRESVVASEPFHTLG